MSTPTPVPASAADTRRYLIERVDDAAVVQLYADGFAELALREKVLIYHLYQAALAGRDIYYDQRYAHNLEMRDVLEEILTHAAGIDPETLAEIERYTKLFWINTGPYNNLTARKFVLKLTPQALSAAAKASGEQVSTNLRAVRLLYGPVLIQKSFVYCSMASRTVWSISALCVMIASRMSRISRLCA